MMTEKRFTFEFDNYNGRLFDNNYQTFYHIEDSEENIELLCNRLNELHEENRGLQRHLDVMRSGALTDDKRIKELYEENEQLKQRNDRQAKQLDRLYRLIEEKDWRTLTDILDDFKRCEEQLQRESGTYGDL